MPPDAESKGSGSSRPHLHEWGEEVPVRFYRQCQSCGDVEIVDDSWGVSFPE